MGQGIGSTFTGEICIRTQPSLGVDWSDVQYTSTQDGDVIPLSIFGLQMTKATPGDPDYNFANNGTFRVSGSQYTGPNQYGQVTTQFCGTLDYTIIAYVTWVGSNNGVGQPGTASPTVGQNPNSYDHWSIFVQMDVDNNGGTIALPTYVQEYSQGFEIAMASQLGVQFRPAATWQV